MSEKIFYRNRFDLKGIVVLLLRRIVDLYVVVYVYVKWILVIQMDMLYNQIYNFLYIMFLCLYELKKMICINID